MTSGLGERGGRAGIRKAGDERGGKALRVGRQAFNDLREDDWSIDDGGWQICAGVLRLAAMNRRGGVVRVRQHERRRQRGNTHADQHNSMESRPTSAHGRRYYATLEPLFQL